MARAMLSTNGRSLPISPPAPRSWRGCCVTLPLATSPVPPRLEENEMPESARKTMAAAEDHAIRKIDMADLPAQRAGNLADAAGARARFFNSEIGRASCRERV